MRFENDATVGERDMLLLQFCESTMKQTDLLDEVQVRRHTLEMIVSKNMRRSTSVNVGGPMLTETNKIDMKQIARDESVE